MLEETRRNLEKQRSFRFKVIDAQSIPFRDGYFDAVIANHMLYHVPDRPAALAEIRRVLKPTGHFYASTVGDRHLVEMANLVGKFDAGLASWGKKATDSFTLENGVAQLSQWFAEIKLYRYEDALEVTEAAPLVDYILSGRAAHPCRKTSRIQRVRSPRNGSPRWCLSHHQGFRPVRRQSGKENKNENKYSCPMS